MFGWVELSLSWGFDKKLIVVISNHNTKVLKNAQKTQNPQEKLCNCRKKEDCPLGGQCLKKVLIYQATVKTEGGEAQNYVGLTANSFKERHSGHIFNFNHEESQGTTLSAYIWQLKSEGKNFEINWKILKHAKPFTPANGQCALCTAEKEIIIFKPEFATLNTRNELGAHCKHKKSKLLYKKPKIKDKAKTKT